MLLNALKKINTTSGIGTIRVAQIKNSFRVSAVVRNGNSSRKNVLEVIIVK